MTRSTYVLFAALLSVSPVIAQAARPDSVRDAERAEDIEVLRRILNHGLGLPDKVNAADSMPFPWWRDARGSMELDGMPSMDPTAQIQLRNYPVFMNDTGRTHLPMTLGPFDGVYLPGHGVVFTLRVPEMLIVAMEPPARATWLAETCRKCHAIEPVSRTELEPQGQAAVALSEWERTQRELHGESVARPSKVVARLTREQVCDPGTLASQIITKLHVNAGQVRHLAAGENVTVVVTFDGQTGSSRARRNLNAPPGSDAMGMSGAIPVQVPTAKPGFHPDEVRALTLGDLHLKQGKAKEAIAAYEQGLARYKDPVFRFHPPLNTAPAVRGELARGLQKGVRDAYAKLAQAYLVAGDVEKAQAALDQAKGFKTEVAATDGRPGIVPVPAKLIVSVPVAELKANADPMAFRKTVRVETVGFPPADHRPMPKQ